MHELTVTIQVHRRTPTGSQLVMEYRVPAQGPFFWESAPGQGIIDPTYGYALDAMSYTTKITKITPIP